MSGNLEHSAVGGSSLIAAPMAFELLAYRLAAPHGSAVDAIVFALAYNDECSMRIFSLLPYAHDLVPHLRWYATYVTSLYFSLTCEQLDGRSGRPNEGEGGGVTRWFRSTQWFWGGLLMICLTCWFIYLAVSPHKSTKDTLLDCS